MISASALFKKAHFASLKRSEALTDSQKYLISQIIRPASFQKFHADRAQEFLLGRLCAFNAYHSLTSSELFDIPVNEDRSPLWPLGFVGSISHDKNWIGAAVAKSSDLVGLGIDFEVKGRAKLNLQKQILNKNDLVSCSHYSDEELLTLIFSMKECLYKALYPQVKKFFGFEDASVTSIEPDQGEFTIELQTDLNRIFSLNNKCLFKGRYRVLPESVLTVLEITI